MKVFKEKFGTRKPGAYVLMGTRLVTKGWFFKRRTVVEQYRLGLLVLDGYTDRNVTLFDAENGHRVVTFKRTDANELTELRTPFGQFANWAVPDLVEQEQALAYFESVLHKTDQVVPA